MLRALFGLIIIVLAAMMSNYLGALYWSIASMIGVFLLYWGLDRYVKKQTNPD